MLFYFCHGLFCHEFSVFGRSRSVEHPALEHVGERLRCTVDVVVSVQSLEVSIHMLLHLLVSLNSVLICESHYTLLAASTCRHSRGLISVQVSEGSPFS